MLLLDSSFEVDGITVHRDHAVPSLFHHLPGEPRLVPGQGSAGLSLTIYRGAHSGGLLTLDVDLALTEERRARVEAALVARTGGAVTLVPVLFDRGTVRVVVLGVASPPTPGTTPEPAPGATGEPTPAGAPAADAGAGGPGAAGRSPSALVERVLATATPSLLGAGRSVFAAALEPEGALLLRDALSAGTVPAIVAYQLAFRGLRPSRGLRIEVDVRQAYEHLRARAVPSTLWFKADVDHEAEALERAGHITVEDVDYTGTDLAVLAARREEAVRSIHELAETFFYRPAATPASAPASALGASEVGAAWAEAGLGVAAFVLRDLTQDEQQSLTYRLDELSVADVQVAPQGALAVPAGVDVDGVVHEVDVTALPPAIEVLVAVPAAADWTGIDGIHVDVRSGHQVRSLVLTADDAEGRVVVPRGPLEHRTRVLVAPDPGALGAPSVEEPAFEPMPGGVLLLDPQALAGRRALRLVLGAVDGSATAAACELRTGDQRRDVLLTPGEPEATVTVWGTPAVELSVELVTTMGTVRLQRALAMHEVGVVVDLPRDRFRTVGIELQDPLGRFQSITVEVERAGASRRSFTLDAMNPSVRWTAPRDPGDGEVWRHRITSMGRDGRVVEEPWVDTERLLLVVGDTDIRVRTVTVMLLGWSDLDGAVLSITADGPPRDAPATSEVVVQPGTTRVEIRSAMRRDGPSTYVLAGMVFAAGRSTSVRQASDAEVVVLLPPGGP